MPAPGDDGATAQPSTTASGSARTAFAQSTYSSQWAVGVAGTRGALAAGSRGDGISTPCAPATPAAGSHPVTPPIRPASGITKSQADASSAAVRALAPSKFSPIWIGNASLRVSVV